jgi:UDP-glucose 4-epimerase|tara:strand:+ start:81 stop:995 length:915 start_codon:yes stop_codon:yes gene_type:complete
MGDMSEIKHISRFLILGHTGFIGQNLINYFRKKCPSLEIIGLSSRDIDLTSHNDVRNLDDFFMPDTAVIVLSAIKRQCGDTLDNFKKNLKMTENICWLLSTRPVGKLIYFSSTAVYGEDIFNIKISEKTPVCPRSYYGMVKYISERLYWKELQKIGKQSLLILRPSVIYGPGDKGDTYGPVKLANAAVKNEQIVLWGDGKELRDFVFIDDLSKIVYRLICRNSEGIVNIASGVSYSFRNIVTILESIIEKKLNVKQKLRTKGKVDNKFINLNLLKEIGGYSFVPLGEGMKTLYDYLQKNEKNND